ncbi:unnamed protein product [Caenorhabditis sp. 36 PRJEB53466]|nr:unnamed protein product [Caenorhabditis sp. 36 PRJEB53466]
MDAVVHIQTGIKMLTDAFFNFPDTNEKNELGAAKAQGESDKENGEADGVDGGESDATHYRINFRHRHRIQCDQIAVDATTPVEEMSDPLSLLLKGNQGETLGKFFQFRHELKNSTYKNKYVIRVDNHMLTFSERDDSVLIRSARDATVLIGSSAKRNMAMEELRKLLKMNFRVWSALFTSNRAEQMGEMDLTEFANSISTENLTIMMDSFQNVVSIAKLFRPQIEKLTVLCYDDYGGLADLEQVRSAINLKLDGRSCVNDEQLLMLQAKNFEIYSDAVTSQGLNALIKKRLAGDIPDDAYACVQCNKCGWVPEDVLEGLEYVAYADDKEYRAKNGIMPVNVYDPMMVSMKTNKPEERLVVVISSDYFDCFKESKKPRGLSHDYVDFD